MLISIKGFFTRYKQPEIVELELSVPSDVTVYELRKVELSLPLRTLAHIILSSSLPRRLAFDCLLLRGAAAATSTEVGQHLREVEVLFWIEHLH